MVLFLSLNVNGLAEEKKRRSVFDACRRRADVIFLQETHSQERTEKIWCHEWGGVIKFSHGQSDARGVCILFKASLDYHIKSTWCDIEGRVLYIGM